jgi:hypothetical protein
VLSPLHKGEEAYLLNLSLSINYSLEIMAIPEENLSPLLL